MILVKTNLNLNVVVRVQCTWCSKKLWSVLNTFIKNEKRASWFCILNEYEYVFRFKVVYYLKDTWSKTTAINRPIIKSIEITLTGWLRLSNHLRLLQCRTHQTIVIVQSFIYLSPIRYAIYTVRSVVASLRMNLV